MTNEKPFEASFSNSDRYTATETICTVVVDGQEHPGVVLGRNGPRTQVRFEMNGSPYIRWFDTSEVQNPEDGDQVV